MQKRSQLVNMFGHKASPKAMTDSFRYLSHDNAYPAQLGPLRLPLYAINKTIELGLEHLVVTYA